MLLGNATVLGSKNLMDKNTFEGFLQTIPSRLRSSAKSISLL
jgi:hypothetical protein